MIDKNMDIPCAPYFYTEFAVELLRLSFLLIILEIALDFGCKFLKLSSMTDKIASMLHVLLTAKFHTVHSINYCDINLDLCPYSLLQLSA